ncbi:MAG: hypothetical protein ACXWQQ_00820 [Pseudobdellovibrio sp.]
MKFDQKLRQIWHDIFYALFKAWGEEFALTCREATLETDTQAGDSLSFRYWLHLSVCQACKNYYDFSAFLSRKMKIQKVREMSPEAIEQFNKNLYVRIKK